MIKICDVSQFVKNVEVYNKINTGIGEIFIPIISDVLAACCTLNTTLLILWGLH